jgi:hypothetical protein
MHDLTIEEAAWLNDALDEAPQMVAPIAGGGNNRVFRIVLPDDRMLVLKKYFWDPDDARDRLDHEFGFVAFAWASGLRCIPRPIARDDQLHLGLYEHIDGRKPAPGEIDGDAIAQALQFVVELNRHRDQPAAQLLKPASESCFTPSQHVARIEGRIARLREHVKEPQALALLHDRIDPAWRRIHARLKERHDAEAPVDRCLSPSDFGYHNVLIKPDGRMIFLDFEYAGWDDPAKLTGDFFSQVAVPVPLKFVPVFVDALAAVFPDPAVTRRRMLDLLPLYRIKWCCIVLNEFIPSEHRRRAFAKGGDASSMQAAQLAKANRLLDSLPELDGITE